MDTRVDSVSPASLQPVDDRELAAVEGGNFLVIREVVGGGIDFEFFGKWSLTLDTNGATACGPNKCYKVPAPN